MKPDILIDDYIYALPDERIARYPEAVRDRSKLLYYNKGDLASYRFTELPNLLPDNTLLVFNNTRVIPARMLFSKPSGAAIEIFCLEPVAPASYEQCFGATGSCVWKCTVGNLKRWKEPAVLQKKVAGEHTLTAEIAGKYEDYLHIKFSWTGGLPFTQVLEAGGLIPIPPYLKRETDAQDAVRYQTVYARHKGSVAAPTAGLHFTDNMLNELNYNKKIKLSEVTLHVGAGTFRPVKTATIGAHVMHSEPFSVSRQMLEQLQQHTGPVVAVGTTSARTLESLYYLGVQCLEGGKPEQVTQWEPYGDTKEYIPRQALAALIQYLDDCQLHTLYAATQILLAPPCRFKIVNGLVTNFHQPQSTLLLLIAAFVGNDWRRIYDYALTRDFRFLSYGDASLLWP
ncbi:MAG: S-adenosylmethionine:tRNA ribosyltransferase-isomerase [Prevotellaceae bacterium]|jgi:S-adenosylmethionine:tRNA ribosyltransferase-isomerase|nr:S-adenosylmethionine:tRNA ribosyltransferase-isomerase [Prevotellaceae bacterium]